MPGGAMLPHILSSTCWCRPHEIEDGLWAHRYLVLTGDPIPRATLRLGEGIPV